MKIDDGNSRISRILNGLLRLHQKLFNDDWIDQLRLGYLVQRELVPEEYIRRISPNICILITLCSPAPKVSRSS